MGRSQRTKGHDFERKMAAELREVFGIPAICRGVDQARDGGKCPDVDEVPGWWVECKKGAATSPKAAMAQARERLDQLGDPRKPVAITQDDRGPVYATVLLEDWLDLVSAGLRRRRVTETIPASSEPRSPAPVQVGPKKGRTFEP